MPIAFQFKYCYMRSSGCWGAFIMSKFNNLCVIATFVSILGLELIQGCASRTREQKIPIAPVTPTIRGPAIDAGSIPEGRTQTVTLSNGAEIRVRSQDGILYYAAEGIFSQESFTKILSQVSFKPE